MEQRTEQNLSPYRTFSRAEWAALREDTDLQKAIVAEVFRRAAAGEFSMVADEVSAANAHAEE